MGFNSVYRFLMEIFPQIDSRLLKAVAIEHSKDADAAANIVLTEILPFWSERSVTSASRPVDPSASTFALKDQSPRGLLDEDLGAEHEELTSLSRRRRVVVTSKDKDVGSAMEHVTIASGNAFETDINCNPNSDSIGALNVLNKTLDMSTVSHFYDADDGTSQLSESGESEELILFGNTQKSSNEIESAKLGETLVSINDDIRNADISQVIDNTESNESVSLEKGKKINAESNKSVSSDEGKDINAEGNMSLSLDKGEDVNAEVGPLAIGFFDGPINQGKSCLDCSLVEVDTSQEHRPYSLECGHQAESGSGKSIINGEIPNACVSPCPKAKQENCTNEDGHIDNKSTIDAVVSRSGQVCRIDLLEEVIEDAKNNKKTLFSALESIMSLMREVELQEKAAEEAKAEASRGGLDILNKVDELKQMLAHAKQANDMHRGEVYGEKSILATEARELQTRLLSLSEERDKSLAVLDQMRVTLEARLAEAEEARTAAEQEKLEKEESARKLLSEQEAIMEKMVQESKLLQLEAEENSKLREFLMDRGQVVDSLQGEISVICQDVRLLKEKFDERVPLSQSVSSSQTTCILASSGSSMKSIASLVSEQVLASETSEKMSPTASIHVESPKNGVEDERSRANRGELVEDDWEIFENGTELYSSAM